MRTRGQRVAGVVAVAIAVALIGASFYAARLDRLVVFAPAPRLDRALAVAYCVAVSGFVGLAIAAIAVPIAVLTRGGRGVASALGGVALTAAYVDARLTEAMGVHLYSPAVTALVGGRDLNQALHLGAGEALSLLGAVGVVAAGLFLIGAAGARIARGSPAVPVGGALTLGLLAVSAWLAGGRDVALSEAHAARALPFQELLAGDLSMPAADGPLRVSYPGPNASTPRLARKPDLLLVLVESLRSDMLAHGTMPELSGFAGDAACDRGEHHQASSHSTDHCFFSVLYGVESYHYQPFGERDVPAFSLRILRENGYQIFGAASAPLAHWGELDYVTSQFDEFREMSGADPAERDRALVAHASELRSRWDPARPHFVLLFFDATHHRYYYPPEFERFKPALPADWNVVKAAELDAGVRAQFSNRYKNSVGYVDHLLGDLLRPLKPAVDRGDLVVAVTGDHGEEFWDRGLIGHAAVSFVRSRIEVPLVLCSGSRRGATIPLSSHVDVMPTLLDAAAGEAPLDVSAWSTGVSLLRPQAASRRVLSAAIEYPMKNQLLVVVTRRHKYWLRRKPAEPRGFSLELSTDLADDPADPDPVELSAAIDEVRAAYRTFL
jgi:hypothetical protein